MPASTPERVAWEARQHLSEASAWLSWPEWLPGREPSSEQAAALGEARRLVAVAKGKLDEVQRAGR